MSFIKSFALIGTKIIIKIELEKLLAKNFVF